MCHFVSSSEQAQMLGQRVSKRKFLIKRGRLFSEKLLFLVDNLEGKRFYTLTFILEDNDGVHF
jgi:hypothetical protein